MISVVIATQDNAAALSETLAGLVGAAVDGMVREVIVADGGSTDATLEIADDAGARILRTTPDRRLAEGCAVARSDWLLILPPGRRPAEGWEAVAAAHLAKRPARAACFRNGLFQVRKARQGEGLLAPKALLGVAPRLVRGPISRLPVRLL